VAAWEAAPAAGVSVAAEEVAAVTDRNKESRVLSLESERAPRRRPQ
jgi:hypothetical protein